MEPENSCRPTMPKIKNMKPRKIITLASPFIDLNRADTYFLKLGIVFSPLSGRSTLSVRRPLRFTPFRLSTSRINSTSPEITIIKSRAFHGSLKYVLWPAQNPSEKILIIASSKKISRKTYPALFIL